MDVSSFRSDRQATSLSENIGGVIFARYGSDVQTCFKGEVSLSAWGKYVRETESSCCTRAHPSQHIFNFRWATNRAHFNFYASIHLVFTRQQHIKLCFLPMATSILASLEPRAALCFCSLYASCKTELTTTRAHRGSREEGGGEFARTSLSSFSSCTARCTMGPRTAYSTRFTLGFMLSKVSTLPRHDTPFCWDILFFLVVRCVTGLIFHRCYSVGQYLGKEKHTAGWKKNAPPLCQRVSSWCLSAVTSCSTEMVSAANTLPTQRLRLEWHFSASLLIFRPNTATPTPPALAHDWLEWVFLRAQMTRYVAYRAFWIVVVKTYIFTTQRETPPA